MVLRHFALSAALKSTTLSELVSTQQNIYIGGSNAPFFMAATIKVDGTAQTFSWQDDQTLNPLTAVDLFIPGTNTTSWIPTSEKGKGSDKKEEESTRGAAGTDKA